MYEIPPQKWNKIAGHDLYFCEDRGTILVFYHVVDETETPTDS
jgi:hypothetical protein